MSLTIEDVEKVAHLARLHLDEAEKAQYQEQLSQVLAYVDKLEELDLEDVPLTTHAVARHNVLREDLARPSLPLADVLFNAPAHAQNQFLIQSILDDAS